MTTQQRDLIGKAVNFEPFISDFASGTRVGEPSYVTDGGFNRGDMMYIYRQYADHSGHFAYPDNPSEILPGTIYKFTAQYFGETNIFMKSSWKPFDGKKFSMQDGDYTYTMTDPITKADSVIWENGSTVRFRCWVLSSLCDTNLSDDKNGEYTVTYPDYSVCDWTTVSGPTERVPMAMRHLGCRFCFSPFGGNAFVNSDNFRIQISTDWEDYMRDDNADTDEEDEADKAVSKQQAMEYAAAVKAAYEKMCFPAGVDMDDYSLLTCENGAGGTRLKAPYTGKTHKHGAEEMTAYYIAQNIRRPEFLGYRGSSNYMVSIPYDMSKEGDGKNIKLPPYTRFRVYLRDVNQGDKGHGVAESDYHIFVLSDVNKRDDQGNTINEKAFPDGITLRAGYSYHFYVGYRYDGFTVTASDDFRWIDEPLDDSMAEDQIQVAPEKESFDWWHTGINEGIQRVSEGRDRYFSPVFHISNVQEFQEFIDLVNGNFTYDTTSEPKYKKGYVTDPVTMKRTKVAWYTSIDKTPYGNDTIWATREQIEADGYLLYNRYFPSDADRAAYAEEDILDAPYSFYDTDVQSRWTVYLDADLDLADWHLETIGRVGADESDRRTFAGNFDGQGHILTNVYMSNNGQIFGYAENGVIKNLRIISTHPVSITGQCDSERILGCSIVAPSVTGALAEKATGICYFVGCSHIGDTKKALVTQGDKFFMYGCMQAASGITGGALCGVSDGKSKDFVMSQGEFTDLKDVELGDFACNYFDITLSPSATAVTGLTGTDARYNRRQYIRGVTTNILCAKNDNLVDVSTDWKSFEDTQRAALYGVAPWRAMNYGIKQYNDITPNEINRCSMHYINNPTGYVHRYPELLPDAPVVNQWEDVTDKYN